MIYTTIEEVQAVVAERHRQANLARRASSLKQSTTTRVRLRWIAALLSGAVLMAACGGTPNPVGSPVSEEQAIEMAESALQAFNAGDYAGWSQDWSETMKSAIDEQAFLAFRDQALAQLGDYVAIKSVAGAPGETAGFYRWTFEVHFEQADYGIWFGFKEGSPLIEGVQFEEPAA